MEIVYHFLRQASRAKEEFFVKVHIDLPWGGVLDIEAQPMAPYKFYSLVWGIVLIVVAPSFFAIWN